MDSTWIPPGIWADPGWISIHPDPSEFGGNGGNLVGIIPTPGEIWVGSHQENIPTKFLPGAWIPPRKGGAQ